MSCPMVDSCVRAETQPLFSAPFSCLIKWKWSIGGCLSSRKVGHGDFHQFSSLPAWQAAFLRIAVPWSKGTTGKNVLHSLVLHAALLSTEDLEPEVGWRDPRICRTVKQNSFFLTSCRILNESRKRMVCRETFQKEHVLTPSMAVAWEPRVMSTSRNTDLMDLSEKYQKQCSSAKSLMLTDAFFNMSFSNAEFVSLEGTSGGL